MKNILKIIISFIVFVTFSLNTSAQNNTLYWMKHLPQSMSLNPAKQSNCKLFIDVPVLPNFSINAASLAFLFFFTSLNPTKEIQIHFFQVHLLHSEFL